MDRSPKTKLCGLDAFDMEFPLPSKTDTEERRWPGSRSGEMGICDLWEVGGSGDALRVIIALCILA